MIRGSAGCFGIDPTKPKLGQIEFFDENIDHANGIVLADPVFQAFWKQRGLTAIDSLNEAPHPILPQIARESYRENQNRRCVFTQAGGEADVPGWHDDVNDPTRSLAAQFAVLHNTAFPLNGYGKVQAPAVRERP